MAKYKKKYFLFIIRHFLLISAVKSLKKVKNHQKRLKTAEKISSTSFGKLVEIHNTCANQLWITRIMYSMFDGSAFLTASWAVHDANRVNHFTFLKRLHLTLYGK